MGSAQKRGSYMINWEMLTVFVIIFAVVTALGFWAWRWRPGDLDRLQEWGLAGRRRHLDYPDLAFSLSRPLHQLVPPICPLHWTGRRFDYRHLDGRHPEFCEFRIHYFPGGAQYPYLCCYGSTRREPGPLYNTHLAFSNYWYPSWTGCHKTRRL